MVETFNILNLDYLIGQNSLFEISKFYTIRLQGCRDIKSLWQRLNSVRNYKCLKFGAPPSTSDSDLLIEN